MDVSWCRSSLQQVSGVCGDACVEMKDGEENEEESEMK